MGDVAASGDGPNLESMQRDWAERTSSSLGQVDVGTPTDILPSGNNDRATSEGRSLSDMQAAMAERNADAVGDVAVDSPTGILEEAAAQSANTSRGSGSGGPATSTPQPEDPNRGTLDGMGSMTVGDYLEQIRIPHITDDDSDQCRSLTQQVGDLATNLRDTFLDIARNAFCPVLER